MKRLAPICIAFLLTGGAPDQAARSPADAEDGPRQVFEKRILTIFKSPNPSSCVQCHLAGVDLKDYILPSADATFQSLRDQGLIDLDAPGKSKILGLIRMGGDQSGADLIRKKVRDEEYEAFADWIERSVADPRMRALPKLDTSAEARPKRPAEVIRHDRADRLLATFENTVWAMRFRCMGCHTEGTPQNKKNVDEFGERVAWMKAAGPEATLAYLRGSKLLDAENPERSLLLRKPLGEVKHGGGKKFQPGDQGYKAFRTFLEDYARVVKDDYTDAASLPKADDEPARFGTDCWLKLTDTPDAWGDRLLQVNVYARDARQDGWEAAPIASSDRAVWGKGRLWQHNLTLLAAKGSERAAGWESGKPALPRGKYLVKVYVDHRGRLAADWKAALGQDDFVGQAEVESGWPEGYDRMTAVDAGAMRPAAR